MNDFVNRMNKLVDKAVSDAIAYCEDGFYSLPVASLNAITDGVISTELFELMLRERPEIESLKTDGEFFLIGVDTERYLTKKYRMLSQEDVDVMVARNVLWLNDEEGGEQIIMKDCLLKNLNLSHKNLISVRMDGAKFVNVNFADSPMCFATANGTEFVNCNMTNLTAEESEFTGAKFRSCTLDRAYFTHSDFTDTEFENSVMEKGNLLNCRLTDANTDGLILIDCIEGGSYETENTESNTPKITMEGM